MSFGIISEDEFNERVRKAFSCGITCSDIRGLFSNSNHSYCDEEIEDEFIKEAENGLDVDDEFDSDNEQEGALCCQQTKTSYFYIRKKERMFCLSLFLENLYFNY